MHVYLRNKGTLGRSSQQRFRGAGSHPCFFDPLPVDSYDLIVIDPPWPFKTWSPLGQGKSPSKHYSHHDACRHHGVAGPRLAEGRRCCSTSGRPARCLRTVWRYYEAWGITYKTELAWRKVTPQRQSAHGLRILGAQHS